MNATLEVISWTRSCPMSSGMKLNRCVSARHRFSAVSREPTGPSGSIRLGLSLGRRRSTPDSRTPQVDP